MVCLHVDGMLILGTTKEVINKTRIMPTNNFYMKDMGKADLILRMKISRALDGITLSQTHYKDKVIKGFKIRGINEFNDPFPPHVVL